MEIDFQKLLHHQPYQLEILGEEIFIDDGVFAPDPNLTYSPYIILNRLPNVKNKKVLDMGTGTGLIAIVCARNGAEVVAVDIDNKAINNAKENISRNGVQVTLLKSNLYEKVSDKFDFIFANLPILDDIWDKNRKTTSLVEKFLKESRSHLNEKGKIYLPWFSASDTQEIKRIINDLNYQVEEFVEERLGFQWYLFVLSV